MVEGIAATEIAKLVIDLGVTATLLILFVMHFLRKDKDSDKKVTADCSSSALPAIVVSGVRRSWEMARSRLFRSWSCLAATSIARR